MASSENRIFLRVSIPRNNLRGPLAFEQVLASIHGLLLKHQKKSGDETVAFEIVQFHGQLYFVINVPQHLKTLITSQIYSQYPQSEIHVLTQEYLQEKHLKNKQILLSEISLERPDVFPIKRYPQFEDKLQRVFEDPIGPITGALSHLHSIQDIAVLQFVVKPIRPSWNAITKKELKLFFHRGLWERDWFSGCYARMRLNHRAWVRWVTAPVWGLWKLCFGFGKAFLAEGETDPDNTDQYDREERTSGAHDRETVYSACFDKLSRVNFGVNIRVLYAHNDPDPLHAESKLREVGGTFQQFSLAQMNRFKMGATYRNTDSKLFEKMRERKISHPFTLSQEELATIFHLPTETVQTPGIDWVHARSIEPPRNLPLAGEENITFIGKTNYRAAQDIYGIRPEDRLRHAYIIGKTGMGKSALLENMIVSDIKAGKGVGVIDPHGDLAEAVLRNVPKNRTNDVIIFDPSDQEFPIAFNLLEGKNQEQRALIASGMVGVVKKLNIDSWGPRLEHFLRNTILALIEAPDTTMLGITRMLVDKEYRKKVLEYVTDPMVKSFWATEFDALSGQKLAEAVGPIQNKVGQFLSTPIIRNILGQPKSKLDLRHAMDTGKIVIVNLSKGKIGEDNAAMLGSMLITKFQIDAMSRADLSATERRPFMLYVDEFQNFATDSFATILSEARKYGLALTMANQYIAQMAEEVAAAVFGNVGSLISFQVGVDDAKVLAEQLGEEDTILPSDVMALPKYQIYNRIMIDGLTSPVFSARTLPPPIGTENADEQIEKVRNNSRQRYAQPRSKVEDKILRWIRSEKEKKDIQKSQAQKTELEATVQVKTQEKPKKTEGKKEKKPEPKKGKKKSKKTS